MVLYDWAMSAYASAVALAAPFNKKASQWIAGRKSIFRRMAAAIGPGDRVLWLHAASLGEFEQGRPVMEEVRRRWPEYRILLTFFSPSGYELRKDYRGADWVFYLPCDTPSNARRFMKIARPEIAVFVKYEFWLNYLGELRRCGCRTFIISTIFRRDSVFFKRYGGAWRRALHTFERLFVQNEESRELLRGIGIGNVTVAGDTRFDRVAAIAGSAPATEAVAAFAGEGRVLVAGSTWAPDEEIIMPLLRKHPDMKFIIAPHEMDRGRMERMASEAPHGAVMYTGIVDDTDLRSPQLMIIDTIGILSSVYRYASYAYIGGGFGVGIHNTLEAATFGLPIAFGPNYRKFREACEMIALGTARSVYTGNELEAWLDGLEADRDLYDGLRSKAADYVAANTGATDIILSGIFGG